jgi:mRNA interferase RelE/StbE
MIYEIEKGFVKDFDKLRNKQLAFAIKSVINEVANATSINNIAGIKKLTGYKNAYRIRVGEYRIGIELVDNIVIFVAFDHRNSIYKRFP